MKDRRAGGSAFNDIAEEQFARQGKLCLETTKATDRMHVWARWTGSWDVYSRNLELPNKCIEYGIYFLDFLSTLSLIEIWHSLTQCLTCVELCVTIKF